MENIFKVVGRIVYSASADVQRIISGGRPLLEVSAEIEACGDINIYCNDEDMNQAIVLGCVLLAPKEKSIFLNYMVVHEKLEIPCILICREAAVILDYYYELAS